VNWVARLLAAIRAWLRRRRPLPAPASTTPSLARAPGPLKVVRVEEDPDELDRDKIYAVGEGPHLWHISMLCPCGCDATISLNALADDSPQWILKEREGVPSIEPSIWRRTGCRSHFFVRAGRIEWCVVARPRPATSG
jgi:hypothetical protein